MGYMETDLLLVIVPYVIAIESQEVIPYFSRMVYMLFMCVCGFYF